MNSRDIRIAAIAINAYPGMDACSRHPSVTSFISRAVDRNRDRRSLLREGGSAVAPVLTIDAG